MLKNFFELCLDLCVFSVIISLIETILQVRTGRMLIMLLSGTS